MPLKTDLNVTPYYDDYSSSDNFQQVLARPAFAIQARELTQLQSILRNHSEKIGDFVFQEGSVVIPGNLNIVRQFPYIKLDNTYGGETIDVTQYKDTTITGTTSGVSAMVLSVETSTSTDQATLYVRYIKSGTDKSTDATISQTVFSDGETFSSAAGVTHGTTAYSVDVVSAKVYDTSSTGFGVAATMKSGVYYLRGGFVEVDEETIIISKYVSGAAVNARIGFTITETIVTPETDTSLLDNATGTSNFAAKGAHRLKVVAALAKLDSGSTADSSFIELMEIKGGHPTSVVNRTQLGTITETLARRTYNESGDYTIRPFMFEAKESVTLNENIGVYDSGAITDDGGIASTSLLSLKISSGKAYIRGIEIEKTANTFIDMPKARDFNTINAGIITYDVGNYLNITNVYGTPDISFISGETSPYKQISIYDTKTSTRGSASGTRIGVARTRTMEFSSGTAGDTSSVYKLYLFDFRPFIFLTLDGTPSPTLEVNHSNGGVQVKGVTSGATGWVFADGTSTTQVILTNVSGRFTTGEKITASDSSESDQIVETSSNTDITINTIVTKNVSEARQVHMTDDDSGQHFTADIVLDSVSTTESFILLNATDDNGANAEDNVITEIDKIPLGLNRGATGGTGSDLKQTQLKFAEKNISLFKLNKRTIKTLLTTTNSGASDTSYYLRRQFVATANSVGVITLSAGANEVFISHSETDYTVSILTAGAGGSGRQGDLVSFSTGFSGGGTSAITITNNAVFGNGAKVKIIATILKSSAAAKIKTVKLMKQCKVVSGITDAYGTRPTDKTISLGRADAFNIVAILDSEDTGTDAVAPTLTVGTITGTFTKGEKITGSVSGAVGRIINTSSPLSYVLKRGTTVKFAAADIITGQSSGATATISVVTAGSNNITNRFELDTGQRDNYYDISRIVRKPRVGLPLGRILIVYDYMEHGIGDFFTVDSYTDVADQMTYEDIPAYSATKVDPDAPRPTGIYPLQDSFDIRPRAEDITGANANIETVDEITGNSFDFYNRQFDGTGSSLVDFIKPGSLIQSDFEHYLPYRGILYLEKGGAIKFKQGNSDESPQMPSVKEDVMQLAEIDIPAYTFNPQSVTISRFNHRRYTMKDIGMLEQRIQNVEYYTALNLLERDAESFEIQDANGLNRFKSGFVVDDFTGHRVGDVLHKDYKNSIDMEKKELRPSAVLKGVGLIESVSTDSLRTSSGYQKTGDLITLPYSEVVFQEQPYASRIELVSSVLLASWVGTIELDPFSDEWFETEVAPDLIINVEGNFDTFTTANRDAIGTVWNAWQTVWTGTTSKTSRKVWQGKGSWSGKGRWPTRTTYFSRSNLTRTGIQTEIVSQIDLESQGTKVIQKAFIPFCRARNITFTGTDFYPNIRLYGFFDKRNVNAYITPLTGFTTNAADVSGVPVAATPLITSASGGIKGVFSIPDPKIDGNPKFRTGEVEFRLTSSSTDVRSVEPETAGNTNYMAVGILETEQETFNATRNATLRQTTVSATTTTSSSSVVPAARVWQGKGLWGATGGFGSHWPGHTRDDQRLAGGYGIGAGADPLAQTFIVGPESNTDTEADVGGLNRSSGRFITSVDIFFSHKDSTLPITLEIRNVNTGLPGPKILPFGRVTKTPSEITTSLDATTATTFTFSSPIYLQHETEYCIAVMCNTQSYKVWISRMGETDIGGSRTISEQPHVGVLYKGWNNRTWAPSLTENLKFVLRAAKFDTSSNGVVTLNNDVVPSRTLDEHPLVFTNGNTALFVNHKNHQMYSTSNNVTISGVVSGVETTLAAALDSTSTSITLTSGTNFNDTTGKYAYDSSSQWWIKINDEIMKYTTISGAAVSSITRAQDSTTAAAHTSGTKVELYMLHKVPFTEINKTHTSIVNINIDSYTISLTSSPTISGGTDTATNGGSVVKVTENASFDTGMPIVSVMEVPSTSITATIQPMTSTSPSGSQSSFTTTSSGDAISINLNDNKDYDIPYMIASTINESNENGGNKSLILNCILSSDNTDVSPVIDIGRMSFVAVGNKLNNIDSSSDVYPTSDYISSTEPDGDSNAAIYLTKKITLENAATALKIFFAAYRHSSAEIKVYYKILRTDDASDFDDLGYEAFNTDGSPDDAVFSSTTKNNFLQYVYTAGTTDDGIGTPLNDFISFQIKIVMQGTNTAEPPRIKELRCIALAM